MPKRAAGPRKRGAAKAATTTQAYKHTDDALLRPDVGLQAQFKKRKPPRTYRYDPSLDPALSWDDNAARARAEALIALVGELAARLPAEGQAGPLADLGEVLAGMAAQLAEGTAQPLFLAGQVQKALDLLRAAAGGANLADLPAVRQQLQGAAEQLRRMSSPFLNWAGKAERGEFTVPTLPLFVHERLSTRAILESVRTRKRQLELFSDPQLDIADRALRAYEYKDKWVNRLILGDSLVVMNSLLEFEGLGGQVQMIYIDPPYGVKFGSNFQPFVRKRDVKHNADDDLTREPEMVQAYRDTWELGLHSYLTYLRDRLLLARELLTPSGSIFVQISDENLHHVRELLDELYGPSNFVAIIPFRKKTMPLGAKHLESVCDYLLWYAKDVGQMKYHKLYEPMSVEGDSHWNYVELPNGVRRKMTKEEINNHGLLPAGSTPFQLVSLYPAGVNQSGLFPFTFRGKVYTPPKGNSWFTHPEGMQALADANRIEPYEDGATIRYVLKLSDAPFTTLTNLWADTSAPSDKQYVVQTSTKVVQRCILMTTDPGDLVFDPTCGGGTTAYVAEQWGRRWITCDTSRVPLALTRQRLLTATFPYFKLLNETAGLQHGFVYQRRQDKRGNEVGGIVPYISKGSIANSEKPHEVVLIDRPEVDHSVVRVSGPFWVEATLPAPMEVEAGDGEEQPVAADYYSRMLEALRLSPVLRLPGNKTVQFKNVRPPARSLNLHAEALTAANGEQPVAFVFGPESGAVTETLVYEAVREAHARQYTHLYVIGFAWQDAAQKLIAGAEGIYGMPTTYVNATMDLAMGDLLKTSRASQVFSVTGQPDVRLERLKARDDHGQPLYRVTLRGVDVFDPVTMQVDHKRGDDVPAWFLDTDYDASAAFVVGQAFFPRTSAWDNLKRALKGAYDDSVWEHLAGTTSEPFAAGKHERIAVKVIDDRGNELMVTRDLKDAEPERQRP